MADTRAINIILAGMIIFLIIGAFYIFLTKATIEKQKDEIRGSAGTIQIDRLIAEWVYEQPEDLHSPEKISISFENWFKERGFVVYSLIEGKDFVNCKEETPMCREEGSTIRCSFAISKKQNDCPEKKYEKTILMPEKNGARTITLKGRVVYE